MEATLRVTEEIDGHLWVLKCPHAGAAQFVHDTAIYRQSTVIEALVAGWAKEVWRTDPPCCDCNITDILNRYYREVR